MNALGGHLKSGIVAATCEIFLTASDMKINRKPNEDIGLNQYNL